MLPQPQRRLFGTRVVMSVETLVGPSRLRTSKYIAKASEYGPFTAPHLLDHPRSEPNENPSHSLSILRVRSVHRTAFRN